MYEPIIHNFFIFIVSSQMQIYLYISQYMLDQLKVKTRCILILILSLSMDSECLIYTDKHIHFKIVGCKRRKIVRVFSSFENLITVSPNALNKRKSLWKKDKTKHGFMKLSSGVVWCVPQGTNARYHLSAAGLYKLLVLILEFINISNLLFFSMSKP